ncbi:hypothetical protein O3W44_21830 [Pantoea sp. LMR881]|uniref:hypothetical protein n=1 Tax=Pantoea sp. LMR881 TaxID=3014336 RepID=UPI0022AE979D|nr:hypothetical protein [Pantoea sp. LMR881]MCZ4061171.1 hypothetical protein [Pantoea sp. LMR881]
MPLASITETIPKRPRNILRTMKLNASIVTVRVRLISEPLAPNLIVTRHVWTHWPGSLRRLTSSNLPRRVSNYSKREPLPKKEQARREAAQRKLEEATAERDALKQQLADTLIMQKQIFIDAQVMAGKTPEQARRAYLEHVKSKLGN